MDAKTTENEKLSDGSEGEENPLQTTISRVETPAQEPIVADDSAECSFPVEPSPLATESFGQRRVNSNPEKVKQSRKGWNFDKSAAKIQAGNIAKVSLMGGVIGGAVGIPLSVAGATASAVFRFGSPLKVGIAVETVVLSACIANALLVYGLTLLKSYLEERDFYEDMRD